MRAAVIVRFVQSLALTVMNNGMGSGKQKKADGLRPEVLPLYETKMRHKFLEAKARIKDNPHIERGFCCIQASSGFVARPTPFVCQSLSGLPWELP